MPASTRRLSKPLRRQWVVLAVPVLVVLAALGTFATVPAVGARQTLAAAGSGRAAPGAAAAPVTPIAAAASPPAPGPALSGGWRAHTETISVGGSPRTYLLVRRPGTTAAAHLPVLVVLHGRGMTPAATEAMTGFRPVVGGAILVYPAGVGLSWNAGTCCGAAHQQGVDDVSFIGAVVKEVLHTQADASSRQVFVAGFSNGGRMAFRLACALPGVFAGIASTEAVPVHPCPDGRALPVLEMAAVGDPLLSIDGPPRPRAGEPTEPTVTQVVADWRTIDGCSPAASVVRSGRLTTTTWATCSGAGRVELALYQSGGHTWPVGGDGAPPAQQVIWRFFHPAPSGAPAVTAMAPPPRR
jgi:polyhydroxybutyrate depolymerase